MSGALKLVERTDAVERPHLPFLKLYVSNWQGDELLALCSMSARGLLVELMCLMHRSVNYGYLLVNGVAPTDADLARLVRASGAAEVRRLKAELLDRGVLSVTADGVLYSRRMVRTAARSAVGREHGKRGGNPALRPLTPTLNPPPQIEDKTQIPETRYQTPKPPVLTEDTLGKRAAGFLNRCPAIYARVRSGAHYQPKEARDFPTALELVAAHPDDERLDTMYEVFLKMPADACRGMNRPGTVNQFAHVAPECDRLLRENGR